MFGAPMFVASHHAGGHLGSSRYRSNLAAFAVAAYIVGGILVYGVDVACAHRSASAAVRLTSAQPCQHVEQAANQPKQLAPGSSGCRGERL
jgi:hypothetical protein